MGNKLNKGVWPAGHGPNDFKCFGPPATKDGEFQSSRIADLGCFTQDGKDSNKYVHSAVAQSTKKPSLHINYREWGRTGAHKADFQIVECTSEADAVEEHVDYLLSKNLKRGKWETLGSTQVLRPRVGKSGKADDLYLVRAMATRDVGLPDGKTITLNMGAKVTKSAPVTKGASSKPVKQYDPQVVSLMKDLNVATVAYARASVVGNALPMQSAIDEVRDVFLTEAKKRVAKLGSATIDQQAADTELRQITSMVYSRIPKVKPLRAAESTWILSAGNIGDWERDLDAFEQALYSNVIQDTPQQDPFGGMAIDMEYVDPHSDLGKFLYAWWPNASKKSHGLGEMKIKNAWKLERHDDRGKIEKYQDNIVIDCKGCKERPIKQPSVRNDILIQGGSDADVKRYHNTNTALLFHGTRSVNVPGIMRTSFRLPAELVGVVITGAMFGGGIYFADDWMKSANYTSLSGGYYSSGSGGVRGRGAFMFACDTVLGEAHVAPGPRGYTGAPKGTHCIFGKAGTSGVQNNEWITFKKESTRLRYLVEFETNRGRGY